MNSDAPTQPPAPESEVNPNMAVGEIGKGVQERLDNAQVSLRQDFNAFTAYPSEDQAKRIGMALLAYAALASRAKALLA